MTIPFNGLVLFGALLLLGSMGSALASRTRWIPGITGMIAVGFLAGPEVAGVVDAAMLSQSRIFVDIALGLILFQLGLVLDLREFFREPMAWLAATGECLLTFLLVFAALTMIGVAPLHAALAAALAVSSSPAVLLLVVRELGAKGPVTELALKLVAFNNVVAFLLFTALLPLVHHDQALDWMSALSRPLVQLAGSVALGAGLAAILIWLSRLLVPRGSDPFSLVVAMVLLALGASQALDLAPLMALLTMGLAVRNLDSPEHLQEVQFGRGGELFFLILFVFAGANLHIDHLAHAVWPVLAFLLSRFAAKSLAVFAVMRVHGHPMRRSALSGLTLLPMAGMAIGLVQTTQGLYPQFSSALAAIVFGAVAVLETIGPVATEFALKQSGEVDADAAVQH